MKTMKVDCQGCGAGLEVASGLRYVTCNYCDSRLEIVQDDSVTHTRVLERLAEQTDSIADNLKVIELQNELERLDREWNRRERDFMVPDKHGNRSLPTGPSAVVGGVFVVVFGIFWTLMASSMTSGMPMPFSLFPVFGFLIVGAGIVGLVRKTSKAAGHDTEFRAHRRERAELERRLEAARREASGAS